MGKSKLRLEDKFSPYNNQSINLPLPSVPTRTTSIYTRSLSTNLSKQDHAKFKALATAMNVSPSALLRGLVVDAINEESAG